MRPKKRVGPNGLRPRPALTSGVPVKREQTVMMMDEYRVVLTVPKNLPKATYASIRTVLDSRSFKTRLRRAVRGVFAAYPELGRVTVKVEC